MGGAGRTLVAVRTLDPTVLCLEFSCIRYETLSRVRRWNGIMVMATGRREMRRLSPELGMPQGKFWRPIERATRAHPCECRVVECTSQVAASAMYTTFAWPLMYNRVS